MNTRARRLTLVFGALAVAALGALGLGIWSVSAVAQTNTDLSGTPSGGSPSAPAGPVVMPPTSSTLPGAPTAAPSAPSPDDNSATQAPGAPAADTPGTIVSNPGASPATGTLPPLPKGEEIYDIRPPFFYLRSWMWLWVVLATAAVVALLYWLWRRLAGRGKLSAKDAYSLALEQLEQARALMDPENPEPYGVAVSEAVRTYLGQRFGSPSSRRTTEEFLRQMEADPGTPLAAHRDLLREFLQACDLFKFAKYRPGPDELEQVHQRAVSFVTATKPTDEVNKGAPANLAAQTA